MPKIKHETNTQRHAMGKHMEDNEHNIHHDKKEHHEDKKQHKK
ncbi:hypothetical protein [Oceanirhabdus seepicola]|nr:hypothetical protein [Oceanirhabdus seepicola]